MCWMFVQGRLASSHALTAHPHQAYFGSVHEQRAEMVLHLQTPRTRQSAWHLAQPLSLAYPLVVTSRILLSKTPTASSYSPGRCRAHFHTLTWTHPVGLPLDRAAQLHRAPQITPPGGEPAIPWKWWTEGYKKYQDWGLATDWCMWDNMIMHVLQHFVAVAGDRGKTEGGKG